METSSLGMHYQAQEKLAEGPAKSRPVAPVDHLVSHRFTHSDARNLSPRGQKLKCLCETVHGCVILKKKVVGDEVFLIVKCALRWYNKINPLLEILDPGPWLSSSILCFCNIDQISLIKDRLLMPANRAVFSFTVDPRLFTI